MKQTFTVRLPIHAGRPVRRAIVQRILVDADISNFVLEALLDSGRPNSDPGLLAFAISTLEEFAERGGHDGDWVSDHIAAAYHALARYREAYKDSRRSYDSIETKDLWRAAGRNAGEVDVHAMIDRKSAFGLDWSVVEDQLLDLITTGRGSLSYEVRSIGPIEVRGAGPRELGEGSFISRLTIEHRGDRDYVTAVVTHRTATDRVPLNHDYDDVVRVAVTPATIVADSEGISADEMIDEARSIRNLSKRAQSRRGEPLNHQRYSRRMMNARNNYFRQYAVRVAKHAEANNMAVELAFIENNTRLHPRLLGVTMRHRKLIVNELFRQCARRGVKFLFPRTSTTVPFEPCEHGDAVVVGVLQPDNTITGLCDSCALTSTVVG